MLTNVDVLLYTLCTINMIQSLKSILARKEVDFINKFWRLQKKNISILILYLPLSNKIKKKNQCNQI